MKPTSSSARLRQLFFWLAAVILLTMLVNTFHRCLWGPDETREAEIARETLLDGHWVTPRFNQIPFVEKPPLYYDLVAVAFRCARAFGVAEFEPGAARLVSALFGVVMLLAVVIFAWRKMGVLAAFTACTVCIAMPQFYRAAHWILLDIAVGAFVTTALVLYGFMALEKPRSNTLHALFFLCAAAAFLTKGTVTLVYLGIVIVPYWIWKRRALPCKLNWTLLCFLIPVGLWIWAFYREGGLYYLHEHFVNNIIGRFLHRDLHLSGSPITISDVGPSSPWSFYLERSPSMVGVVHPLLPLIFAALYRALKLPFFAVRLPGRAGRIYDRLTAPRREISAEERDLLVYLIFWSFLPIFFFSLSAIKEVTYLLPSYAGVALLTGWYFRERFGEFLPEKEDVVYGLVLPTVLFAVAAQLGAWFPARIIWMLFAAGVLVTAMLLAAAIRQKAAVRILFLILSGAIGAVLLGSTPEIMRGTRRHRKCYHDLVPEVWRAVGERPLFLHASHDESIRGSVPFYGNRAVTVLPKREELQRQLAQPGAQAVMMNRDDFRELMEQKALGSLSHYTVFRLDFPEKADEFLLLLSKDEVR